MSESVSTTQVHRENGMTPTSCGILAAYILLYSFPASQPLSQPRCSEMAELAQLNGMQTTCKSALT